MSGEWQAIETAPKDGTKIIGWKSGWTNDVGYRFPDEYKLWFWNIHEGIPHWESTEHLACYKNEEPPSHWMPLPEPPK